MSGSLKTAFARRTTPRVELPTGAVVAKFVAYAVVALAVLAPSILGDLTDHVIARRGLTVGMRWGIAALAVYVLTFRRLHWWEPVALLLAITGLLGNYAQHIGTTTPVTIADQCARTALALFVLRLLFRPTPAEDRAARREAEAEAEMLRETAQRCVAEAEELRRENVYLTRRLEDRS